MIRSHITEPVDIFKVDFTNNYSHLISQGFSAAQTLIKAKKSLEIHKNDYFKATAMAEKAQKIAELEDEHDRVTLASQNAQEMKKNASKASENYFNSLAEEKQH